MDKIEAIKKESQRNLIEKVETGQDVAGSPRDRRSRSSAKRKEPPKLDSDDSSISESHKFSSERSRSDKGPKRAKVDRRDDGKKYSK